MARPVNANAEETRGRILDAASQLFAQHGYEGASVRQIASAAGVSLGMIRHYSGSKDGLYDACIASAYGIYDGLGRRVRENLSTGDPVDALAEAVREGFRHARQHIWACRLVLWDMMQSDRWRSERNDRYMVPFALGFAKALAAPLGRSETDLALATRTLIFLVVRYATADVDEIARLLTGGDEEAKGDESTMMAVEDHLVDLARRLYR